MKDLLRDVNIDGYRLRTWDTGACDRLGKSRLAYQFDAPGGKLLFEGEAFYASPVHAIDSDECLRALLSFLTLRPGDTDREYFDSYTPEQMDFAQGPAEQLSLWTLDVENGHVLCTDCEERCSDEQAWSTDTPGERQCPKCGSLECVVDTVPHFPDWQEV